MLIPDWQFFYEARSLTYRIIHKVRKTRTTPFHKKNQIAELPAEGRKISVETALNSRCTSDYTGCQEVFHWGRFHQVDKLSEDQIAVIVSLAKIPLTTVHQSDIEITANTLTLSVADKDLPADQRKMLMIENGMQQQAICLVCSCLGVGIVFDAFPPDQERSTPHGHKTIRIDLDAQHPPYEGSYWTTAKPSGRKPWIEGNLPEPKREGDTPLLDLLANLQLSSQGAEPSLESVAQLLWAARGRTPHYYKSKAWGMTIPTSQGAQDRTAVYAILENRLARYENWTSRGPTHSLSYFPDLEINDLQKLQAELGFTSSCIILSRNGKRDTAYGEIGYQLLNILLQAQSQQLKYEVKFPGDSHLQLLQTLGVTNAECIVCL